MVSWLSLKRYHCYSLVGHCVPLSHYPKQLYLQIMGYFHRIISNNKHWRHVCCSDHYINAKSKKKVIQKQNSIACSVKYSYLGSL